MLKGGKIGMGYKIIFFRLVFIKYGVDFFKIFWYNLNDIVVILGMKI